jgi:hypothetical protein
VSRTVARLITGLAITVALFWTVVLAVSLSVAWFWHVTRYAYKQARRPGATTTYGDRKGSDRDARHELSLTRNDKTV